MFFLQALMLQGLPAQPATDGRRALVWLGTGAVLTFALSTLWLHPPVWVYAAAAAGGAAQLVGCIYLVRGLRGGIGCFSGAARGLVALALAAFLLKHALQAASVWPGLTALANHRFTVIAFLHLVFLGVVTPLLLAWALRLGWLREGRWLRAGLGLFLAGAVASEAVVASVPLGVAWPQMMKILLAAALAMTVGVAVIFGGLERKTPLVSRGVG